MGGVIAAAYAAGVPLHDIEAEAVRLGKLTRMVELVDRKFHLFSGLFNNTGVQKYLARLLGELAGDRGRVLALARAARALAVPDAAERVARACLEVCDG